MSEVLTDEQLLNEQKITRRRRTDTELIRDVANSTGFHVNSVRLICDEVFKQIRKLTTDGETVTIKNFGRFMFKDFKPRITNDVNNPGMRLYTPARARVVFSPWPRWGWRVFALSCVMPKGKLPNNMRLSNKLIELLKTETDFSEPDEETLEKINHGEENHRGTHRGGRNGETVRRDER